ncbi:MAG: MerR family transcriptional regulator [Alphaproteobacteria bacterium]|jgi:DNA-binding transcriptional MerR regulator|tara:strand:- start:144 stop:452 length:309 start_codon:yes stop_codon:yes gene_type:complete
MNKNFYNIDEVSQIVGEQKHTIRFWESRISKLKIIRTHSGHRLYDYENLLLLKKIKELLEVQKLTLDGVNDYLSKSRIKNNSLNENIVSDLKDLLNVLKRSK